MCSLQCNNFMNLLHSLCKDALGKQCINQMHRQVKRLPGQGPASLPLCLLPLPAT